MLEANGAIGMADKKKELVELFAYNVQRWKYRHSMRLACRMNTTYYIEPYGIHLHQHDLLHILLSVTDMTLIQCRVQQYGIHLHQHDLLHILLSVTEMTLIQCRVQQYQSSYHVRIKLVHKQYQSSYGIHLHQHDLLHRAIWYTSTSKRLIT